MASGKKRSAAEADVATPEDGIKRRESPGAGKDTKRGPKVIPAAIFKAHAVPLHVTVTDTPPTVSDDNTAPPASADQVILGTVALQPCTFTTGSYGWKGSRRLAIDIVDPASGEKHKVQVMLSINATVIGSKQAEKEAEVEAAADPTICDAHGKDDGAVEDAEQV